jgi:carbohydrate-binding DOMON domain-containing protein
MLTNMNKIILILVSIVIFAGHSLADDLIFRLDDPEGDDNGPGYYVYPTNPVFRAGSFDVTGFEVSENKEDVIFKVYFKNWFSTPPELQISNTKNLKDMFRTILFLQNIDIYIDKDHKYNSGTTALIPGRNAKASSASAWEQAVFISPLPFLARSEMKRLAEEMADKVIIPSYYEVRDTHVQFKVPKKILGQPDERWGYLIVVTGAEWESSLFSLSNWMRYGSSYQEPVLTRIVAEDAGEWEFGGGDKSGAASNIIDMFVGTEESQEKMLSSYDPKTKKRAVLSAVYPFPSPLEEGDIVSEEDLGTEAEVIDIFKNVVTIDLGSEAGVEVGKLGQVYDANEFLVATVIVEETREKVSIATIIPITQRGEVAAGMKVRFK